MNEIQVCKMKLYELSSAQMQEINGGGGLFEWAGELVGKGAHYVYNWAQGKYVPAGCQSLGGHVIK